MNVDDSDLIKERSSLVRTQMKMLGLLGVFGVCVVLAVAIVSFSRGVPIQGILNSTASKHEIQINRMARVDTISVKEGELVKTGQELLFIDTGDLEAQKFQLQKELEKLAIDLEVAINSVEGIKKLRVLRSEQLDVAKQTKTMMEANLASGLGSESQLLEAIVRLNDVQARVAELDQNIGDTQDVIRQLNLQKARVNDQLEFAERQILNSSVKAKIDGQILKIHKIAGTVARPGETILELIPQNAPLVIQGLLPPQYRDQVSVGYTAKAQFSIFASEPMLTVDAVVSSISDDVTTDESSQVGYSIVLDLRLNSEVQLVKFLPGMPVSIIIVTGERTLAEYIIEPLLRRLGSSLNEY